MATLTLGGKTVLTQTGSDEPVLGSNLTGSPALSLTGATTFPAGTILQVAQTKDSVSFSYTNTTSSWYFGTASGRASDSHGGVASNLNCTLTTKGVNSNFLVCGNLQFAGANSQGYTWGMNTYWSFDSYATPLAVGEPSSHGVYSSGTGVQSGFWQDNAGDGTWYPHYTQVLKTGNTIAKNTSITFKIVIGTHYTSAGNIVYYNRQNTTDNGQYRLVPVSTHTIYEIAT